MSAAPTEKFSVRNLDCANCATKIEKGLKAMGEFDEVSLDFANSTLHVKTNHTDRVIDAVKQIDPGVQLTLKSGRAAGSVAPADETFDFRREGAFLGVAAVLFFVQLMSEHVFESRIYHRFEIGVVLVAYLFAGWNVLLGALRTVRRGRLFDENVLMLMATVGAMAIGAYSEAIGVMLFYKIGELLQELAVSRSRKSIRGLLAIRPDKASLKTDTGYREVPPESVSVGAEILVRPGERIPLDGEILSGRSQLDTSALTGESLPVTAGAGDPVMAGQINGSGSLSVKVTRPFAESSIAKVMELVENATARKAKTEKFITVFAGYYTPAVVAMAAAIALIPPYITGESFQTWIYRALVLLVISCPCALVISIPLGYFGGIGRASRRGILVKGSNFIDALAAVKTVVFDKTGTLTRGGFEVKEVVSANGVTDEKLLEYAAAAEYQSTHPIADAIRRAYRKTGGEIDPSAILDHTEYTGKGVVVRYHSHPILVGNDAFLHENNIDHPRCDFDDTVVMVVVDGVFAGHITIGDELKADAAEAVSSLKDQGIRYISMLTGDNQQAAALVAGKLGLDGFHAGLLPEDKVAVFEQLNRDHADGGRVAFVGDGINDAPVIARADVGVAMGALGSDAAIETADVVLMTDSPAKMAEAVAIARQTRRIVWQNIVMALSIKAVFIAFGAFGLASMWEAVFADVGTALLAVGNATRLIGWKKGEGS